MKHLKVFENFDKYDFGRKYGNLVDIYGDIKRAAINMTRDEINVIKTAFGDKYHVAPNLMPCFGKEKTGTLVTSSVKPRLLNCAYILSMGDYVYGVVFYERKQSIRGMAENITKIFICDDLEMVIECISEYQKEI